MNARLHLAFEVLILCGLLIASFHLFPGSLTFLALQLFSLLFAAHRLAELLLPDHPLIPRLLLTLGTLLGIQSVIQTAAYYTDIPLGLSTDVASQILSLLIAYGWISLTHTHSSLETPAKESAPTTRNDTLWAAATFFVSASSAAFVLWQAHAHATTEAIRTPWTELPPGTLLAFIFITAALWICVSQSRLKHSAWLISTSFFITLASVTVLLYPLGFGFDGFLHRASEEILLTTGDLTPKPPYYLGQYTLVTWLSRSLSLPLASVDAFLLAGCLLLLTASLCQKRHHVLLLAGLPFLIPLRPWITATPQSLAYAIGLTGLLLTYTRQKRSSTLPGLVLGLWSITIHPLAGLPLLGTSVLVLWRTRIHSRIVKQLGSALILLSTISVVPLAFFINSRRSGASIDWQVEELLRFPNLEAIANFFTAPTLRISPWADWSAFVNFIFPGILLGLAVYGTWARMTRTTDTEEPIDKQLPAWLLGTGCLVMLSAWILQHAAVFTFLIEYERHDYAQRLGLVSQLILLPLALSGLAHIWQEVRKQPSLSMYACMLTLSAWQGARIYQAFPYHDATHVEHGWNVSAADKEAVRWIERDSQGQPYTVLANQSVSAAAINELGFKRYAGEVFFYPVPTGGPLYQAFLRVASIDVTSKDLQTAARLGETQRVYVVLNHYWWQADEVAEKLTPHAKAQHEIGNGRVRIYRFEVTNEMNF